MARWTLLWAAILSLFLTIQGQSKPHPQVRGLQAMVDATKIKDCWICTHADIYSEEQIALVSGPVPLTWWVRSPRLGWGPTWVSNTDLAWRPTRREGKYQVRTFSRKWERNWYSLGIPEFHVESLMQHPICIQNENGTGQFLGVVPHEYCAHTWIFDSLDGEFVPAEDDYGPPKEECEEGQLNVGEYFPLQGGQHGVTSITLFNFTEGGWGNDSQGIWNQTLYLHDRMGILVNKTADKNETCDNGTYTWDTPFWRLWHSIACAFHRDQNLTHRWYGGAAGDSGTFSLDDHCKLSLNRGEKKVGKQRYGYGNFLTLILNEPGMYWVCGRAVYKALPPGWRGRCAPSYLAPRIEVHPHLNTSRVLNLGSSLHRGKRDINPVVERNAGFHKAWREILPGLGAMELERAIMNISREIEKSFNDTLSMLMDLQLEVPSFSQVVLQNRRALDILAAQQGGACALIGGKCCYYIDKNHQITQKAQELKNSIKVFHDIGKQEVWDLWGWLTDWLPNLGWLRSLVMGVLVLGIVIFFGCCFANCAPAAYRLMKSCIPENPNTRCSGLDVL
ncbi:endogenous retroviral envelope protein HEMO-like [Hemicordylus capensis]|uniref:endogenous retroviral envelope protein HEMO-like n=1 Tax=Hemicordylus capensis TaxID=884348 RepID=UPI0023048D3D|nr:endogenous retroviral envelope protein HEMO-like [Hemicordylus capensis]XP_053145450.1 endogenous retroviral envelope protein HEMO-like [Hemicordylus capensis]